MVNGPSVDRQWTLRDDNGEKSPFTPLQARTVHWRSTDGQWIISGTSEDHSWTLMDACRHHRWICWKCSKPSVDQWMVIGKQKYSPLPVDTQGYHYFQMFVPERSLAQWRLGYTSAWDQTVVDVKRSHTLHRISWDNVTDLCETSNIKTQFFHFHLMSNVMNGNELRIRQFGAKNLLHNTFWEQ